MLRLARRAVPLGLLVVVMAQANAFAATTNVSATNSGGTFFFQPMNAKTKQGNTVLWTNTGTTVHTSTSDTTMPVAWDSGTMQVNGTFSFVFTAAGKYTYHCAFHQALGMVGSISVPVVANPPSGTVGTKFTIRVATVNATGTLVYDIQKKDPGGQFADWMTGITSRQATFDSTGLATGTYQFRARVRDTSSGKVTQYSAAKSIQVT